MIHKPFEEIDSRDIASLIANKVREGRTIEYKRALPTNADKEKKEFLADVSAFANAAGGDLLFGVDEERDGEGKTTGVPENVCGLPGINADQETRRLDSMLQAGIGPRIAGVRIRVLEGDPGGAVLLIRVPKSYAAPHMVTFQDHSRFYSRNNGGKYPLDVSEIRSAFALSESLPERIRRFRDERLARVVAAETPVPLVSSPKFVLHLLPVAALNSASQIDLPPFQSQSLLDGMQLIATGFTGLRYNFDGILSYGSRNNQGPCDSYVQLFRTGAVEGLDAYLLTEYPRYGKQIPSEDYEREIIRALARWLKMLPTLGVDPPAFVMLSVLGVKGYQMQITNHPGFNRQPSAIDRDALLLPEAIVDDFDSSAASILRPAFDAVWQAAGHPRSRNYDQNGKWISR